MLPQVSDLVVANCWTYRRSYAFPADLEDLACQVSEVTESVCMLLMVKHSIKQYYKDISRMRKCLYATDGQA